MSTIRRVPARPVSYSRSVDPDQMSTEALLRESAAINVRQHRAAARRAAEDQVLIARYVERKAVDDARSRKWRRIGLGAFGVAVLLVLGTVALVGYLIFQAIMSFGVGLLVIGVAMLLAPAIGHTCTTVVKVTHKH